jgi:uncharacterized ferritin-like protein (DUF455 family)
MCKQSMLLHPEQLQTAPLYARYSRVQLPHNVHQRHATVNLQLDDAWRSSRRSVSTAAEMQKWQRFTARVNKEAA